MAPKEKAEEGIDAKKPPPAAEEAFWKAMRANLLLHHVDRGGPLAALLDVERHPVALGEGLEAGALNGGIVNEDVVPFFPRDETKTLLLIEPLNDTCCHDAVLLKKGK
jgi:hypothetical protein